MSTALQDSAMLFMLSISQWTARKFDKKATNEVNTTHGAKDAGRFNKLLIDKTALDPMSAIESNARSYHYSMTLPWGNLGERLLPAALFMEYTDAMNLYKREFEQRANEFAKGYPQLVQDARQRLGTLYEPGDYPAEVRSRFAFLVEPSPIPSANDFRVNLNSEYVDQIKSDIANKQNRLQAEANKHLWERIREVVGNIQEVCSKDKPRIYDSMIEKAELLVSVLPAMNLTNDPELTRIATEMKALLVPPDTLRSNLVRRKTVANAADQIMSSISWV